MLKYMVEVTMTLLLVAIELGLTYAYAGVVYDSLRKRILLVGSLLGVASSIIMAYMKNATSRVNTGYWNLFIFGTALLLLVVFLIFSIQVVEKKLGRWSELLAAVALAGITCLAILYAFPDIWAYPYTFVLSGQSVFSTEYLYNLIGYVGGLVLMLLVGSALWKSGMRFSRGLIGGLLKAVLAINALRQITVGIQVLLAKRIIKSNHTLFEIAKFSSNNSNLFIYGAIIVALIVPIILFVRGLHINEPYHNPAEHRKIRAKWRNIRRWSAAALVCMVLSVLNMTVINAYANKAVELSPVEDSKLEDGSVVVDFEQVEDGHLHRFAYTTDEGIAVRFIVIKKPESSAYGIGLDACDICGETGYYERDGQVVCNLCDVVMNINTIGFKGGCNPIVIDYEIHDGKIYVPVEALAEQAEIFTR